MAILPKNIQILFFFMILTALVWEFIIKIKQKTKQQDYDPLGKDKTIERKLMFYVSQMTIVSNTFLLLYYLTTKEFFFRLAEGSICGVTIGYWLLLAKRPVIELLSFRNLQLHLFSALFIIYETLKGYCNFNSSYIYCIYFVFIYTTIIFINYKIRSVWVYGYNFKKFRSQILFVMMVLLIILSKCSLNQLYGFMN